MVFEVEICRQLRVGLGIQVSFRVSFRPKVAVTLYLSFFKDWEKFNFWKN